MITRENLQTVLNNLTIEEIDTALEKPYDYLEIWLHTFNTGFFTSIQCYIYDEELQQQADDNGQLFIDKDDFLYLLEETNHDYFKEA